MAKKEKKEKVKKVKEAAPKKAKKKSSGGGPGLKQLVANHFEKALLGFSLLLTLVFVWSGFQGREGIESTKTPVTLDKEVKDTETLVNTFTWDKDFKEVRVDNQDFPQRAGAALRPLESEAFATNRLIRPPVSPPKTKRSDPDLFAATDLQVVAGFGVLDKSASRRGRPDRRPGGIDDGPIFQTEEEDDVDQDDKNVRPIPQQAGANSERGLMNRDHSEGVYFAGITALVPVRKQLEDYQSHLEESKGKDERRDVPHYVNWILERSEVDAAGNATGYQQIADGRKRRRGGDSRETMRASYGNQDSGTVHPDFEDPTLTMRIPPVDARDADRIFVHQRIRDLSKLQYRKAKERAMRQIEQARDGQVGAIGGEGGWRERRRREGGRPREGGQEGGRGGEADYQSGDGGQSYQQQQLDSKLTASMSLEDAPEYYMFRYVDMDVEVGQTYRYRLQLVLDDPNNSSMNGPSQATLEPSVIARVQGAKESKERLTEFSEESAPVLIRRGQTIALAKASPAPTTLLRDTKQSFQRPLTYPTAEIMALIFDAPRATEIPGLATVTPGAAVSFESEVEVPIWNKNILRKEKHEFHTDFDVLDIRGGDEASVKSITKPGQILVFDRSGRISVINELETEDLIDKFTFPKEDMDNRREGGFGGEEGNPREGGGRRMEGGRENRRSRSRDG